MFDASDRDITLLGRIPTNTPLQALVTLNDPVYEEAAEALARRVLKDTAGKPLPPRAPILFWTPGVPESKAPGREVQALRAVGSVLFNLDAALVR